MNTNKTPLWALIIGIILIIIVIVISRKQDNSTVKIGALIPVSGTSAALGEWMKKGALAAQDEINANGGINGQKLELIIEDDQCDGKTGIGSYRKMHDLQKINYFAGPLCAAVRIPVLKSAENDNSIIITTGLAVTYGQDTTAKTFNVLPSVNLVTSNVINYAFDKLNTKTISLLKVDDAVGKETEAAFMDLLKARGLTNPHVETFAKGTLDMRSAIAKIISDSSDTVFVSGFPTDYAVFIKQAKELGLKKKILTLSSLQTPDTAKANASSGLVMYYSNPSDTGSLSAQTFLKSYQSKDPSASVMSPVYLGSGYDSVMILAKAMKECGNDARCAQTFISKLTDYPGANGSITFGEKGNVNSAASMEIRMLKDGVFTKVQ